MEIIESYEFLAQVGVASDLRTFQHAIQRHPAVLALSQHLAFSTPRKQLLGRIFRLSKLRIDPRYENAADTPLAVYLSLLAQQHPPVAALAAEIVSHIPQCWWADKTARHIILKKHVQNSAGNTRSMVILQEVPQFSTHQEDPSGESLIIGAMAHPALTPDDIDLWSTNVQLENRPEILAA